MNNYLKSVFPAAFLTACLYIAYCGKSSDSRGSTNINPEFPNGEWPKSSLSEQNIDSALIYNLVELIDSDEYDNVHCLLIVRNGFLVLEEYFNGYNENLLHECFSMTKTISALVTGMAVENGYIDSIGIRIQGYFADYGDIDWSSHKSEITVKNMLTMTSGLQWEELDIPYPDPRNSHYQMSRTDDWTRFVLERPMEHIPGGHFEYNTGTSNMLAIIIDRTTGISFESFADSRLFEPLGITSYYWARDPRGNPCAGGSGGGVRLLPRDMAKIGYLMLKNGVWGDSVLISASWIEDMSRRHVDFGDGGGYGYQTWIRIFYVAGRDIESYYAIGYGGQFIFIIEESNLVVVYTSGNFERDYAYTQAFDIMSDYVLPAVGE